MSFGFAMVNYYSNPIPGVGVSFHNLVTNESAIPGEPDQPGATPNVVTQGIADFESRMDSPGFGDFLGTAIYTIVIILLAAAQAIAIRCDRLRIHRHGRLCPRGADLHSLLYRSEDGMALLGLVPMLHPVCLLSGHRRGGRFYHWESHHREPSPPAGRHALHGRS